MTSGDRANAVLVELETAQAAADRNTRIDRNSALWGELKEWLLDLSNKKCWFSGSEGLFQSLGRRTLSAEKECEKY